MDVSRHFRTEIYVSEPGPTDIYGTPTYSDPYTIKVRWEWHTHRIVSRETGNEEVSDAKFMTTVPITPSWRIWSPGQTPGTAPSRSPRAIDSAPTLDGRLQLYEVHL